MEQELPKMESLKLSDKEAEQEEEDYSDIRLRLLDLSDVDDCMEWLTDEKVSKFCSWDCFTSKEAAMQYVADVAVPHPWFRAICLKNKPVGTISVTPFKGSECCRGEVGYILASKYWGKGIATRAVKMAASTIFVEWPHLERLDALVDVENPGSQRVLEKVGFTKEGVLRKYCLLKGKPRDVVMFSLLYTDPHVNFLMHDESREQIIHWEIIRDYNQHMNSQPSLLEEVKSNPEIADDYSHISLRKMDISDINDLMTWATDDEATQFYDYSDITTRKDAKNYIVNQAISNPWLRAICIEDRAIGEIQVRPFEGNDSCRAEIGFILGSKYWGKGIATQAVKVAVSTIFSEWPGLGRLEALVDVENFGSIRVLEKAGFQKEGIMRKFCLLKGKPREMIMFSLLH